MAQSPSSIKANKAPTRPAAVNDDDLWNEGVKIWEKSDPQTQSILENEVFPFMRHESYALDPTFHKIAKVIVENPNCLEVKSIVFLMFPMSAILQANDKRIVSLSNSRFSCREKGLKVNTLASLQAEWNKLDEGGEAAKNAAFEGQRKQRLDQSGRSGDSDLSDDLYEPMTCIKKHSVVQQEASDADGDVSNDESDEEDDESGEEDDEGSKGDKEHNRSATGPKNTKSCPTVSNVPNAVPSKAKAERNTQSLNTIPSRTIKHSSKVIKTVITNKCTRNVLTKTGNHCCSG